MCYLRGGPPSQHSRVLYKGMLSLSSGRHESDMQVNNFLLLTLILVHPRGHPFLRHGPASPRHCPHNWGCSAREPVEPHNRARYCTGAFNMELSVHYGSTSGIAFDIGICDNYPASLLLSTQPYPRAFSGFLLPSMAHALHHKRRPTDRNCEGA